MQTVMPTVMLTVMIPVASEASNPPGVSPICKGYGEMATAPNVAKTRFSENDFGTIAKMRCSGKTLCRTNKCMNYEPKIEPPPRKKCRENVFFEKRHLINYFC